MKNKNLTLKCSCGKITITDSCSAKDRLDRYAMDPKMQGIPAYDLCIHAIETTQLEYELRIKALLDYIKELTDEKR